MLKLDRGRWQSPKMDWYVAGDMIHAENKDLFEIFIASTL